MYLKKDKDGRLSQPIQMEDIERVIFLVRHKSGAHIDPWTDRIGSNLKSWIYPYLSLLGVRMTFETLSTIKISDLGDENLLQFTKEAA